LREAVKKLLLSIKERVIGISEEGN